MAYVRHMGHVYLLGKLKLPTSTLVSPAESDYKCSFLRLVTNKRRDFGPEARDHSNYDSTET
jgi:hypothetical protein